jgi:hypothetical protein
MIEEKKVTVGGKVFLLRPLSPFKAVILDKKVMELLLPLFNGFNDLKLDANINVKEMVLGLTTSFSKMKEAETIKFISDMFYGIAYFPQGQKEVELTTETIDQVFAGDFGDIYMLMYEVMKHNKFTPFRMVVGGKFMTIVNGLKSTKKSSKKEKKQSEKLEN